MIIGVFSVISQIASTATAIGSAHFAGLPPNNAHFSHSSQAKNAMIRPCVKWLGEYQSVMCWLLPLDCTTPCHSLISPHSQIGGRSMANNIARVPSKSTPVAIQALRCGASVAFIHHLSRSSHGLPSMVAAIALAVAGATPFTDGCDTMGYCDCRRRTGRRADCPCAETAPPGTEGRAGRTG